MEVVNTFSLLSFPTLQFIVPKVLDANAMEFTDKANEL